jgi:hypothetical protein
VTSAAPTSRQHRRPAALLAIALAAALVGIDGATPASAGGHQSDYTTNCPKAESLVRGTTWHAHRLATGVTLREGRRTDATGFVDMHVLTADVLTPGLSFRPLVRKLAMRSKLSDLARGHSRLVAATNTGYFDFGMGTPLGPVVYKRLPMLGSATPVRVVGFNALGRLQAGHLSVTGTVTAATSSRRLVGLNVLNPETGITAYTTRWGSAPVDLPYRAVSRYVDNGVVTSSIGDFTRAPRTGSLLVARGSSAVAWLSSLRRNDAVTVRRTVTTDAPAAFTQAYAVGSQLVLPGGVARTGLTCRRRYPMPARTAIGFADRGRRLILTIVADRPGTSMHGLDANQMSRLMADLGAREAYLLDGSGSSELLARMPASRTRLSLRNYPADGGPDAERPMPVGFGVFHR